MTPNTAAQALNLRRKGAEGVSAVGAQMGEEGSRVVGEGA